MKEIKFTTRNDTQMINGDPKHLALCPRCNNPVVILGVYKQITPHERHVKERNIPRVDQYDEDKYEHCPYHRKTANYIKEYVPEIKEQQRQRLYESAFTHYDKDIYLLQKATGIHITHRMAEDLAQNYARVSVYNYIDETNYTIPWYSFSGFPLHHMIVQKNTTLYRHLQQLELNLKESYVKGHVYVETNEGYWLTADNYKYVVDDEGNLNGWLHFSIIKPDNTVVDTLLYVPVDRFSISVDWESDRV